MRRGPRRKGERSRSRCPATHRVLDDTCAGPTSGPRTLRRQAQHFTEPGDAAQAGHRATAPRSRRRGAQRQDSPSTRVRQSATGPSAMRGSPTAAAPSARSSAVRRRRDRAQAGLRHAQPESARRRLRRRGGATAPAIRHGFRWMSGQCSLCRMYSAGTVGRCSRRRSSARAAYRTLVEQIVDWYAAHRRQVIRPEPGCRRCASSLPGTACRASPWSATG